MLVACTGTNEYEYGLEAPLLLQNDPNGPILRCWSVDKLKVWADRYMWQSRLYNWGEEKVEKEKGQFLSWKQEEGWQVEHYEDGQVWTW